MKKNKKVKKIEKNDFQQKTYATIHYNQEKITKINITTQDGRRYIITGQMKIHRLSPLKNNYTMNEPVQKKEVKT